jgi:hypothetical protein
MLSSRQGDVKIIPMLVLSLSPEIPRLSLGYPILLRANRMQK